MIDKSERYFGDYNFTADPTASWIEDLFNNLVIDLEGMSGLEYWLSYMKVRK